MPTSDKQYKKYNRNFCTELKNPVSWCITWQWKVNKPEKETSKNFVKENILNIKSNVETNALESHLTRIRKKMNRVSTTVKIRAKNEKLIVTI